MNQDTDFKNKDAASYDNVVAQFDRHTQVYSTYVIDTLLQQLKKGRTNDVIDIGCGSGVVTLELARSLGDSSRIMGIDLSDGMLDFARRKAAKLKLDLSTSFQKRDAEQIDLPDESFDAAVSLYAFRHFPNPDKAAREAYRILRPGGRLIAAVGSGPSMFTFDGIAAAFAQLPRRVAQMSGRELCACDFLDRLVDKHCRANEEPETAGWTEHHRDFSGSLASLAKGAGFTVEKNSWLGKQFVVDSVDQFWELQITFSSVARKRIAQTSSAELASLEREFRQQCEAVQARGGRLVYRVGAAIIRAVKA